MTTAPATTSGPRSAENARNFGVAAAKNSAVSIATGADYPPSDFVYGLWAKIALKDPWNTHDLSGQCGPTPKKYPNLYQVVNSLVHLAIPPDFVLVIFGGMIPPILNHHSSKSLVTAAIYSTPFFPNPALHSLMVLFRSSNPGHIKSSYVR